jgi:hypothetical protein
VLREQFDKERQTFLASDLRDEELIQDSVHAVYSIQTSQFFRATAFLDLYYASLYSAVEKWREWEFRNESVSQLLESDNLVLLKKFRHVIFHGDHRDHKDRMALGMEPSMIQWSSDLLAAIRGALLESRDPAAW